MGKWLYHAQPKSHDLTLSGSGPKSKVKYLCIKDSYILPGFRIKHRVILVDWRVENKN